MITDGTVKITGVDQNGVAQEEIVDLDIPFIEIKHYYRDSKICVMTFTTFCENPIGKRD